jgi:2-dehydro-3-deoxyglucarate aldolase/4-hydroxy-2-oxoheptanedioate aldolase
MSIDLQAGLARMRQGATFGSFLASGSDVIADVMGSAGFDWLLVDLEHGAGVEGALFAQVSALRSHGLPTLVRVESPDRIRIGRVLDLGVDGVMVPRVDSAGMAADVVSATRYPPTGQRGVAVSTRAAGYGGTSVAGLPDIPPPLVVLQIETAEGVHHVDSIAAVEGVDSLFVGPADLSVSLGVPGETAHPLMYDAMTRVLEATRAHDRIPGIMAGTVADAQRFLGMGFRLVAVSSDVSLLSRAACSLVASLRTA